MNELIFFYLIMLSLLTVRVTFCHAKELLETKDPIYMYKIVYWVFLCSLSNVLLWNVIELRH